MTPRGASAVCFCWGPFLLRSGFDSNNWQRKRQYEKSKCLWRRSIGSIFGALVWEAPSICAFPKNLIFQCMSSMCHSERQKMKIFWGFSVSKDPESNVLGTADASVMPLKEVSLLDSLASPSSFSDSIAPFCFSSSVDSWHNRQHGIVFCSGQRDRVALHSDVPFFSSRNCPSLSWWLG